MCEDENILKISNKELKRILVHTKLEKICNCSNRCFLIDFQERIIQCKECGAIIDPFEVLKDFTNMEDDYWRQIKFLREEKEQLEKWLLNNRLPVKLKEYASEQKRGLTPICPTCNNPFDLQNIKKWVSVEYAKVLLEENKNKLKGEQQ